MNGKFIRALLFSAFLFCSGLHISAQERNTKINIAIGGYALNGIAIQKVFEFNSLLEKSVINRDTRSFIELSTVNAGDLNRIRMEFGNTDKTKNQHIDWTLFGDIIKLENVYHIITVLIHNKTTRKISLYDTCSVETEIPATIQKHGQELIAIMSDMQMPITLEAIHEADALSQYDLALRWIELYKIQNGNSPDLELLEKKIQQKAGRTPPPPSLFDTIDTLSRAKYEIEQALSSSLPVNEKERMYGDSKRLLTTIAADQAAGYEAEMAKIEEQIAEYERKHIDDIFTGGIEVAFFMPFVFNDFYGFGNNILDYYPGVCGVQANWLIPVGSATGQPYLKLQYLGFANQAVLKAEYLEEAALYEIALTAGYQWQWQITKHLFPYVFTGIGYAHFLEYAKDSDTSAIAHFGGIVYEGGGGLRVHITPNIVAAGGISLDLNIGQPFALAISYSAGVSCLFYGKANSYIY